MWKTVPVRESNQKFRLGSSSSHRRRDQRRNTGESDDVVRAPEPEAPVRENEVNGIVKQVRRVSNALRREQWVIDLIAQAEEVIANAAFRAQQLQQRRSPTTPVSASQTDDANTDSSVPGGCHHSSPTTESKESSTVALSVVALGIGSVVNDHHAGSGDVCTSSLLQLGLLHCVFDAQLTTRVEQKVNLLMVARAAAVPQHDDKVETPPLSEAPTSTTSAIKMCIEYFDPVLTEFDKAVCTKLGYTISTDNYYGGYTVDNACCSSHTAASETSSTPSPRVLVAYMPHASATLYHNLFAANWFRESDSGLSALDRLVVIGNNLANYDAKKQQTSTTTFSFTRLMPALRVQVLFRSDSRSRKLDRGIEGMSFMEVERAFSDMCLTTTASTPTSFSTNGDVKSESTLAAFLAQLAVEKKPKIVRDGADTL